MNTKVLKERVFRAGYIVRTEVVSMDGYPDTTLKSAYTPSGEYIGSPKTARMLIVKRGIAPRLRDGASVCSIGYSARDKKWYGWSHRAICGFRVGDVVKAGDCTAAELPVGYRAVTLVDAKRMAEAFAESVS